MAKSALKSKKFTLLYIGVIVVAILISAVISTSIDGAITQTSMANACQEEASLKLQNANITVTSVDNYNPQFYDTGDVANDGTHIKELFWNGKLKDGSNSPQFVCKASGTKNHVHIESLQYGTKVLD